MTSGISHPIGNLEAAPPENGEVPAKPRFWCTGRTWRPDHQLLSGYREDVLRTVNDAWKVRKRTIDATPTCSSTVRFFPRHSNSGCGVQHVAGLSVTQHEREDVRRPFDRLLEGRPMPPVIEQYQARVGNVIEDRDADLKRHNALVAPVDQEDRRLDAR